VNRIDQADGKRRKGKTAPSSKEGAGPIKRNVRAKKHHRLKKENRKKTGLSDERAGKFWCLLSRKKGGDKKAGGKGGQDKKKR